MTGPMDVLDRAEGPGGPTLAALVELAREAVRGTETVDVLMLISERAVDVLPVEACGVLVRDVGGALRAVAASSASAALLDLFQAQSSEGPCVESIETGEVVAHRSSQVEGRWPQFGRLLAAEGFGTVHAVPMMSRRTTVGALNLFGQVELGPADRAVAQAFADLAVLALLQGDLDDDAVVIMRRLHRAVQARATLGQAVGVLAERHGIDPDAALRQLKELARSEGVSLTVVALEVARRVGGVDPAGPAGSASEGR